MKSLELTNPQLVTVAVALLDGHTTYVDREEIAIQVNDLAPGRFNWRKFPDRIDMVTVVVALRDAKKPKNGGLLIGDNNRGWMLSPQGSAFVSSIDIDRVVSVKQWQDRKESLAEKKAAECSRLRRTNAYLVTQNGNLTSITRDDFHQFVRINSYFQSKARARRIAIVDSAVSGEEDLQKIWTFMKTAFPEEFN